MPVKSCQYNGKPGWQSGDSGKCYTYAEGDEAGSTAAKAKAEKQGSAAASSGFEESFDLREVFDLTEAVIDEARAIIPGVKILGRKSRNGREYTQEAMARALPLYEGVKVNIDHNKANPTGDRSYRDRFGTLRNVRLEADGIRGDFHYNPKHAIAEQFIWDVKNTPSNVGFSHNAHGSGKRTSAGLCVEQIDWVKSVDIVSDPASTRSLFESEDQQGGHNMADATPNPADTIMAAFRDAMMQIIDGTGDIASKKKALGELLKQSEKASAALGGDKAAAASAEATPAADATSAAAPTAESFNALKAKVAKLEGEKAARELLESAGLKPRPEWVETVALLESDEKRLAFMGTLPRVGPHARSGMPLRESAGDTRAPNSAEEFTRSIT